MKYVIYGAGHRGKRLFEYIKNEDIVAFIDLDKEKQKKKYCGKPVISLEEYINTFFSCFIIISPINDNSIEDILKKDSIYQYSHLVDMPSEFAGYGNLGFSSCYGSLKKDYKGAKCIYGINAFCFMIYDFLYENEEIVICPERGCNHKKVDWVKKYYPGIKIKEYSEIQNDEVVLSTIGIVKECFSYKTIDLYEYSSNNNYYWNNVLSQFKGIYKKQKKCFVVATGPSLRTKDLYLLKSNNMFCFGVNNILKVEEWVANVYVAADSCFVSNNISSIEKYNCRYKFIGDSCQEYWEKKRDDSYKIHVVSGLNTTGFSEEICQKVYSGHADGGTITYVCLQLAIYMGFSEIYLLGVDCNYIMGSRNNHFIADEVKDKGNHREDLMIKAYECAKKYAENHGIKIYNATRGGMLEVFERVDFDSLFDCKEG